MTIRHFKMAMRPEASEEYAACLARTLFGLDVVDLDSVKELVSYEDRNFYMEGFMNGNIFCNDKTFLTITTRFSGTFAERQQQQQHNSQC